jgi:hypothetical protein
MRTWALAGLLVGLAAGVEVVTELGPGGDVGEALSLVSEKEGAVRAYAKEGFGAYTADGRDELELNAMIHLEKTGKGGAALSGADLGESDNALLQVFSQHKQHQPMKSQAKYQDKEICLSSRNDHNCRNKLRVDCPVLMVECTDQPSTWFYNHFTKRLEMEEGKDGNNVVAKCLHRKDVQGVSWTSLFAVDCDESKEQQWEWQCEAFSYLDENEKTKVLAWKHVKDDSGLSDGHLSAFAEPYYAEPVNLWYYKEVVRHSRCRTKRYKVFKFRGTLATTVVQRSFIGWPTTQVTVQFWMKGTIGTAFSYASPGVPKPPYETQMAISIDTNGKIMFELFDVSYNTQIEAPKFKWFNVAASWSRNTGAVLHINGQQVWTRAGVPQEQWKDKTGEPLEFISGGCFMMGHKAKRPCKERIASSSFSGEIADILVWGGILDTDTVTEKMFAPVAAEYVATILDDAPADPPDGQMLRIAYLTRQYGSQEFDSTWPPECTLTEEKRASMTDSVFPGPNWAKLCEDKSGSTYNANNPLTGARLNDNDCKMYWWGGGDVHYRSFGGCKYDDQSAGEFVVSMMRPD